MTIWIVYGHTINGTKIALLGYESEVEAYEHVKRASRISDPNMSTAAESVGLSGFSVEPLRVKKAP